MKLFHYPDRLDEAKKDLQFFIDQRRRNQRNSKNQRRTKKRLTYCLITIIIFIFGTFSFNLFQEYKMEKYGIKTKAKIDLVISNDYRVNDMDPQWITNYTVWYTFKTKKDTIKGSQQVLSQEYDLYFDHEIKNSDSIHIIYNPENPNENKICKIEIN